MHIWSGPSHWISKRERGKGHCFYEYDSKQLSKCSNSCFSSHLYNPTTSQPPDGSFSFSTFFLVSFCVGFHHHRGGQWQDSAPTPASYWLPWRLKLAAPRTLVVQTRLLSGGNSWSPQACSSEFIILGTPWVSSQLGSMQILHSWEQIAHLSWFCEDLTCYTCTNA